MNRMLNDRENTLMEMLTAGDLPEMAVLREQWRRAQIEERGGFLSSCYRREARR